MRPSVAVTPMGRSGARRDVDDGIGPMKSVITARSNLSTELAALLARGFLRLTENRRVPAISGADSGAEIRVDLFAQESAHVQDPPPKRRPAWT